MAYVHISFSPALSVAASPRETGSRKWPISPTELLELMLAGDFGVGVVQSLVDLGDQRDPNTDRQARSGAASGRLVF